MDKRDTSQPLSDQSRRLQLARWGILIFALGCTLVAAITCRYRFVGSLGPLRVRVSNPLKSVRAFAAFGFPRAASLKILARAALAALDGH